MGEKNEINQTNEINETNQMNQTNQLEGHEAGGVRGNSEKQGGRSENGVR
jgi:hypothetical protein